MWISEILGGCYRKKGENCAFMIAEGELDVPHILVKQCNESSSATRE